MMTIDKINIVDPNIVESAVSYMKPILISVAVERIVSWDKTKASWLKCNLQNNDQFQQWLRKRLENELTISVIEFYKNKSFDTCSELHTSILSTPSLITDSDIESCINEIKTIAIN